MDAWLQENDIRPKRVAKHLLFSFLRQMYKENLFHGDFHPGNVILLRDNHIASIDLGSLGTFDVRFMHVYVSYFRAVAMREYRKAADFYLALLPSVSPLDLTELKQRIVRMFREWEARSHLKNVPYHEKSIWRRCSLPRRCVLR